MKTNVSKNKTTNFIFLPLPAYLLFFAFLLRIILAAVCKGFESDIACFGSWALRAYEGGFGSFYSPDVFTDYPPGYIYILYPIGALLHHLKLNMLSPSGLILLKLPSILSDLGAAYLIYRFASRSFSESTALLLSALYAFNPAVLLNSVVWGQVDSILVFLVLLFCLAMTEGKTIPAYFIFAAGVLLKPQMLVFAPLLLYGIYEFEFLKFRDRKSFLMHLAGGICAIGCLLLAMLPFGLDKVLPQYTDTLGSYPYVSVNAYNFWALLGLNWESQNSMALGISYKTIGTLILVLLTAISLVLLESLRRRKQKERYFLTGAFLITTTFMFSVRMHERYLYPAMLLLLITYILSRKTAFLGAYLCISFAHFLNVWHVLYHYDPSHYYETEHIVIYISAVMLAAVVYFYSKLIRYVKGNLKENDVLTDTMLSFFKNLSKCFQARKPVPSGKAMTFTKLDLLLILAITLSYGVVAFLNLGVTKAPETTHTFAANSTISLEFSDENRPVTLCYYLLHEVDLACELTTSSDNTNWSEPKTISMKKVFSWEQVELDNDTYYLNLKNTSDTGYIGELIFLNKDGEAVRPLNASQYPALFDEADTLPAHFDFSSSAYFDEIYYHRTAYEFAEEMPAYEMTHPPLGKTFIMLGTMLFGLNPFGFRFMGTLFGILMLPFMYLLARNLTGNRILGAMSALCFAFDFMHFTQTRIATIDVFIVFFIILMYYFMERYVSLSFYDTPLHKTFLPLGACGLAFGLGISSKWTGFYAGVGLAIIFFASLFNRYREYKYACANPRGTSDGILHQHIIHTFVPNTLKTIGFCLVFFVMIPVVIYLLSYLPFRDYTSDGLIQRMWNNQFAMYSYHSNLTATHPYSSAWHEWPTMARPVFYYSKSLGNDIYQGISAFGNPLVWYTALPAAIYTLYLALIKHKPTAAFLSIGLLSQFLPWTLVSRCTFLYHYFPCVPFLVLMTCYAASQLKKHVKPRTFYALCGLYTLAVITLFAMFYPVISGMPVSGEYVDTFLRWQDGWVLILN